MDINNNQQTNTFTGGMNTDTSDALLKQLEYRKAVNLRPITNTDSNDGELHLIDGVEQSFTDDHFSDIYATTSIRDIGIVVGKKQGDTGWGIYKILNQTITRIFGPCEAPLGSNLSLVTRWESSANVKLYIADGEHKLMSINIMHTDYTGTPPTPPSSIEYITDIDNNVPLITASISDQPGNIKGVVVQYAYVLYKQYGAQSNMSPLTKPISLYNGNRGFKQNERTDKSIDLSLSYSSDSFNKIRIYRIAYVQNGQEPEVNIILDQDYTGGLNYTDAGYNIAELAYSEFVSQYGMDIKPLLIESKENTLFAANIEYDQKEVDDLFLNIDVTYTPYCDDQNRDYHITPYGVYTDISSIGYGRSLMPGETYRYGIVFYDNKGRRSSVMHIDDVLIPTDLNIILMCPETSGNLIEGYYVSRVGIKAVVDFRSEATRSQCSGYEIVRCERTISDSIIISLGIVGCTNFETRSSAVQEDTYLYNERFASPFMSLWDIYFKSNSSNPTRFFRSAGDLLAFASPEYIYCTEEYKNIINQYLKKILLDLKYTYFINFELKNSYVRGDIIPYWYVGNYESVDTKRVAIDNRGGIPEMKMTGANTSSYIESSSIEDNGFYIRNSYIYPVKYTNTSSFGNDSVRNIKDIEYTVSPEYNKFDNGTAIIIDDDSTIIGNLRYINWSTSDLYKDGQFDDNGYDTSTYKQFVASGKQCMLIHLQDGITPRLQSTYATKYDAHASKIPIPITISNIINTSTVPYGGSSQEAMNNSIFYSFGNYYTPSQLTNSHNIYDGDEYISLFIYNSCHTYNSAVYKSSTASIVYAVPLFSRIDLKAVYGDLYPYLTNSKKYYLLDTPVSFNGYNQEHSAYLYNPAYHQTPIADKLVPIDWTAQPSEKYDTRIIYSNEKTNNEQTDSWLTFKSANYMDVDTRYGLITNLRLFKNSLVFWQERATGVLSVNERTMIQDANNTNIILGNGDVLQRYDYLTTIYGSAENKRCETQSNTTLYWWDYMNGEILGYSGGQSVQPFSKVKNISNYIRSNNKQPEPAVTYDQDNKEVLFNVVKDGTADRCLVYNEVMQSFTSLYDLPFKHSIDISDKKYYIQNNKIFLQTKNAQNAVSTNDTNLTPYIKYVVNQNPQYNKVYDIQIVGGTLYDGDTLNSISMQYTTPLKQTGKCDGTAITNREYDFRLNVPRAGKLVSGVWTVGECGDRLRGKTMQCELWSSSNSTDFSLQYITTKYRMSWS